MTITREVHARDIHAHEIHAYEVHAREVHAREMHAYKMYACGRCSQCAIRTRTRIWFRRLGSGRTATASAVALSMGSSSTPNYSSSSRSVTATSTWRTANCSTSPASPLFRSSRLRNPSSLATKTWECKGIPTGRQENTGFIPATSKRPRVV